MPTAIDNPQRNPNGTFAKGNRGGPGNPYARECAQMRKVFAQRCTEEDLIRIADKMIELAVNGDIQAAKFVVSYRLGKPVPMKDPDRMDIEELLQDKEEAELMEKGNKSAGKAELALLRAMLNIGMRMEVEAGEEVADDSPSTNGRSATNPPSPNGDSVNGIPSPNGGLPAASPSPNGGSASDLPTANGNSRRSPSENRLQKERRKRRKASRKASRR